MAKTITLSDIGVVLLKELTIRVRADNKLLQSVAEETGLGMNVIATEAKTIVLALRDPVRNAPVARMGSNGRPKTS